MKHILLKAKLTQLNEPIYNFKSARECGITQIKSGIGLIGLAIAAVIMPYSIQGLGFIVGIAV